MREGKVFAVDEWNCSAQAFFLTHLHADHTHGLSSHWCRGPIFCSPITATLLLAKFPGFNSSLLHSLPVGSASLVPVRRKQDQSQVLLEVTPIDADHCPGSVMYVFRGEFGCILHTGDFRWEMDSLSAEDLQNRKQQLLTAVGGASVDRLYLDNTFCNARFCFPPRHDAAMQVVKIIAKHKEYDVVIGVDNLGKEELLLYLAKAFETKIWVWPERLQTLRLLGLPDVFTNDTTVTRIRAVPRYSISKETLYMLNKMRPTIAVLPTGCCCLCKSFSTSRLQELESLTNFDCTKCCPRSISSPMYMGSEDVRTFLLSGKQIKAQTLKGDHKLSNSFVRILAGEIYLVPYSLHSCFSELQDFIEFIRPSAIIGNSTSCMYDINPAHHFEHLCTKGGSLLEQLHIKLNESLLSSKANRESHLKTTKLSESFGLGSIPFEKFPSTFYQRNHFSQRKARKNVTTRSFYLCKVLRRKKRRRGVMLSPGGCVEDDQNSS